ncbi:MAG TPA: glycosyltransferase family 9 protein [Candidatus Binatia bacterium]
MSAELDSRAGRVLLVFPGALGDFLLLAPSIAALRTRHPAVELSVSRTLEPLVRELFPGPPGPPADGAAMGSLFAADLHPAVVEWMRDAARLEAWLGEPAVLARHARALGVGAVRRLHVERSDEGPHASAAYASALGVTPVVPAVPAAWRDARVRSRRLVLHPGAGGAAKRWSADGFRAVADAWRARGGETTVLLGPAEADEERTWRASGHEVAAGLALGAVARLLGAAPRYVGNDSGISHLAALVGCRGAVLFGPTRPARWRPLGDGLVPLVFADRDDAQMRDVVLARLVAAGHLDTPTPRH